MNHCPHCGCGCRSPGRWNEVSLGLLELALDIRLVITRLLENRVSRFSPVERRTVNAINEAIREGNDLVGKAREFVRLTRLHGPPGAGA